MATAIVDTKNRQKFDGTFFDEWQQKTTLRLQKDDLKDQVNGTTVKPAPTNPAAESAANAHPGNQNLINAWEEKDSKALLAIWDMVTSNVFSHVEN
ncbi:hypothetical protein R1flu_001732 [Riccia fluitans]|uniref:Uncharacterized protein n=1 Tax=Riccia fluitans TaxID=41844 RepID=A0ABD1Y7F2_9MARC